MSSVAWTDFVTEALVKTLSLYFCLCIYPFYTDEETRRQLERRYLFNFRGKKSCTRSILLDPNFLVNISYSETFVKFCPSGKSEPIFLKKKLLEDNQRCHEIHVDQYLKLQTLETPIEGDAHLTDEKIHLCKIIVLIISHGDFKS